MKISRTTLIGAAMAVSMPLALAATATAQQQYDSSSQQNQQSQQTQNQQGMMGQNDQQGKMDRDNQQGMMNRNSQQNAMNWQGAHSMTGTVDSIDEDAQTVTVSAESGEDLTLPVSSTELQSLSEGDQVTVKLAYATGNGTSGGYASSGSEQSNSMMGSSNRGNSQQGRYGSSGSSQAQWINAQTSSVTVESVDEDSGEVDVTSDQGHDLVLHFPQSSLAQLKEGDKIHLRTALNSSSSMSDSSGYSH